MVQKKDNMAADGTARSQANKQSREDRRRRSAEALRANLYRRKKLGKTPEKPDGTQA
jgi:hypothetical protein